jgi:hypothetical protein
MTDSGGVNEQAVDISESTDLLVTIDDNNTTKRGSRRGLGYSQVEDCMVAKAFIATSEDSIVGVSQKGAQFFAKMQANYTDICKEQEAHDREEFLHYSRRGLDRKMALDYLKTKSKFKSYNDRMRADELRVARPTGNKKRVRGRWWYNGC